MDSSQLNLYWYAAVWHVQVRLVSNSSSFVWLFWVPLTEIWGSWFQFEIHKYRNGDNFEECDKHNDCNWRTLYFP